MGYSSIYIVSSDEWKDATQWQEYSARGGGVGGERVLMAGG